MPIRLQQMIETLSNRHSREGGNPEKGFNYRDKQSKTELKRGVSVYLCLSL